MGSSTYVCGGWEGRLMAKTRWCKSKPTTLLLVQRRAAGNSDYVPFQVKRSGDIKLAYWRNVYSAVRTQRTGTYILFIIYFKKFQRCAHQIQRLMSELLGSSPMPDVCDARYDLQTSNDFTRYNCRNGPRYVRLIIYLKKIPAARAKSQPWWASC